MNVVLARALAYSLSVVVLGLIAAVSVLVTQWSLKIGKVDMETFITARHTVYWPKLAWSLLISNSGAWIVVLAPRFGWLYGPTGIAAIALGCSLPILAMAHISSTIDSRMRRPLSLADFIHWRYGSFCRNIVAAFSVLAKCTILLNEYVAVGAIFRELLGCSAWPIVMVLVLSTAIHTIYGGLLVSICMDALLGMFTATLVFVTTVHVAATFHVPSTTPPTATATRRPLEPPVGDEFVMIATIPLALVMRAFFIETAWQRTWAAVSRQTLLAGAYTAAAATAALAISLGSFGHLAAIAAGPSWPLLSSSPSLSWSSSTTTAHTILFRVLTDNNNNSSNNDTENVIDTANSPPTRPAAILAPLLMAIVMASGQIGALMHALVGSLAGGFAPSTPIAAIRVPAVVLNFAVASCAATLVTYAASDLTDVAARLFYSSCTASCCGFVPCAVGAFKFSHPHFTGTSLIIATAVAVAAVSLYGIWHCDFTLVAGIAYIWWRKNPYDPLILATAFSASLVGSFLSVAVPVLRAKINQRSSNAFAVAAVAPAATVVAVDNLNKS